MGRDHLASTSDSYSLIPFQTHLLAASVSPMLVLADILIASLPSSHGPREGSGGLRTCLPPYLPALLRVEPALPQAVNSDQLQHPSHHPIPCFAALFFHQAEQEILSLNDLNGCLLSWLRGQGPSLGRKKMAVWSCGMDSSCSAYLRAQGPLDSLYPAWAFSLSVAGQCLGL